MSDASNEEGSSAQTGEQREEEQKREEEWKGKKEPQKGEKEKEQKKAKKEKKEEMKKKILRSWLFFLGTVGVAVGLVFVFPDRQDAVVSTTRSYLVEMALVLPAVMVLIGLFNEWVSDELVVRYLGGRSGATGIGLAIGLGSLPTGPLYVAFPIASELLAKNARVSNVVVFLTAWACLKLPQELVELQFLGWKFMTLRLGLTTVVAVGMGLVIEAVLQNDFAPGGRADVTESD